MVASVRGVNMRNVTIGQNVAPPGPLNVFLDNYSGPSVLLNLHTPDIGNAWTWVSDPNPLNVSRTSGSGTIEKVPGGDIRTAGSYQSLLTHTGTILDFSFFVTSVGNLSNQDSNVSASISDSTEIGFTAGMHVSVEYNPDGSTIDTFQSFSVLIDNNYEFDFFQQSEPIVVPALYRMTIDASRVVRCYVDGNLVQTSAALPVFTETPDRIRVGVADVGTSSSVSLTIDNPTPV